MCEMFLNPHPKERSKHALSPKVWPKTLFAPFLLLPLIIIERSLRDTKGEAPPQTVKCVSQTL